MPSPENNLRAFQTLLLHLRNIVGQRNRNDLHQALLLAARAILVIENGQMLRVWSCGNQVTITPLVSISGDQLETHSTDFQFPAEKAMSDIPEYRRCYETGALVEVRTDSLHRYIFPIFRHGKTDAVLELGREHPFDGLELEIANLLLGLFAEHLSLLDYAETDTLTGLLNRKTFDENLLETLICAQRDNPLSQGRLSEDSIDRRHADEQQIASWLAVADIDHFKRINDLHGHIIGDEVLILVARLMRHTFRLADQLFRFGGEEFVVVLQPTTQENALAVVERFRAAVESQDFPLINHLTISVGITRIEPEDTPTEVIGRADQALYVAKNEGRNQVKSYEQLHQAGYFGQACPDKPLAEIF